MAMQNLLVILLVALFFFFNSINIKPFLVSATSDSVLIPIHDTSNATLKGKDKYDILVGHPRITGPNKLSTTIQNESLVLVQSLELLQPVTFFPLNSSNDMLNFEESTYIKIGDSWLLVEEEKGGSHVVTGTNENKSVFSIEKVGSPHKNIDACVIVFKGKKLGVPTGDGIMHVAAGGDETLKVAFKKKV